MAVVQEVWRVRFDTYALSDFLKRHGNEEGHRKDKRSDDGYAVVRGGSGIPERQSLVDQLLN